MLASLYLHKFVYLFHNLLLFYQHIHKLLAQSIVLYQRCRHMFVHRRWTGGGGGGSQGIRINSFTVNPTNISVGTTFTMDWSITTSNYCWLAVYAYSQPTLPSGNAKFNYKVAEAGCPITLGTVSGGFVCTINRQGNDLLANCTLRTGQMPQTETLAVRGPAYLILEACTLISTGTGINTVCDTRSVAVNLPQ